MCAYMQTHDLLVIKEVQDSVLLAVSMGVITADNLQFMFSSQSN